ncbi:MAG: hypothetical protein DME25_00625 [Verrucomicrobia bacterium]|nr:MAG: hypothetical protein DME25_00625 [Verrucomicrobiota bacterium]
MSVGSDNEFDLEKLFLPAWAQEPSSAKSYAKYEGQEEKRDRREERRGPHRPRREGPPQGRRDDKRPRGEPGKVSGPPPEGRRPRAGGRERPAFDRDQPRERRPPPTPLPEIALSLVPEEKGVENLAKQIKMTGRAFPLFEIAQMILERPERHSVAFNIRKNPEGKPLQPLFVCALDDTLWLSEDEAIAHVLKRHFATFYQAERTPTEPPKGKYTFVAQCGVSGMILGPPNYHDYQNQLRKLHAERFSRMPFELYKSRVRIVRDEAVVKKWVEDQSWKTEYICLNLPEPLRLGNLEAVEKHFRETHKDNIIKTVESHTLSGTAARSLRSPDLVRLVRSVWEDQRRFPLQIATVLSQQFAAHGLQFFKVNKTVTHVWVARPHFLDLEATPVSEGVKRIVELINAHPKCTRRRLLEALAPAPAAERAAPGQDQPPAVPPSPEPTPEQTAVIADLHWLIHQGHVIEFANGTLETAKKPVPKPPRPEAKTRPPPAQPQPQEGSVPAGAAASSTGDATPPKGSEAEPSATQAPNAAEATTAPDPGPVAPQPSASEVPPPATSETPVETNAAPAESTD